ncbi:MAG: phosphopyruvate hydratase [Blautia sp.]
MYRYLPIRKVYAREVLDSRGNPTVEVEVTVGEGIMGKDGITGRAIVPSGASTGKFEAVELRDGEKRYLGLGVEKAVNNVNVKLAEAVLGENALDQCLIDSFLLEADGTANKEHIGANAVLGVSMAVAKAAAKALHLPLYQYMGGIHAKRMPVPMMNILNGGKHADNTVDFQEFMIMPVGAENFREGLRMCAEIYQSLKKILKDRKLSTGVGDEGGFAPDLAEAREVFLLLNQALEKSGYKPGRDVCYAMDAAASELFDEERKAYYFPGESQMKQTEVYRNAEEMVAYYRELTEEFPIVSIEDGLYEDDWDGWQLLTDELGESIQLVGDDLFVTNVKRLKCGIKLKAANAILIKVNQIGTLTEAMDAVEMAHKAGYRAVISHRSGESEDTFIADLAVAAGAGQIKTGAPCRGERTAKYNRLLRIEDCLDQSACYENPFER